MGVWGDGVCGVGGWGAAASGGGVCAACSAWGVQQPGACGLGASGVPPTAEAAARCAHGGGGCTGLPQLEVEMVV